MKKILFTLLLFLSSLHSFELMSYEDALLKAQKEDKVLMVMIGRSTCNVCNYMKKVVFRDKEVIKTLDANFASAYVELDFDDVPNGLTFIGTPTFYFLDKNEKILSKFDGGKTKPSFLKALAEFN